MFKKIYKFILTLFYFFYGLFFSRKEEKKGSWNQGASKTIKKSKASIKSQAKDWKSKKEIW
jgi:hypothetical protein